MDMPMQGVAFVSGSGSMAGFIFSGASAFSGTFLRDVFDSTLANPCNTFCIQFIIGVLTLNVIPNVPFGLRFSEMPDAGSPVEASERRSGSSKDVGVRSNAFLAQV